MAVGVRGSQTMTFFDVVEVGLVPEVNFVRMLRTEWVNRGQEVREKPEP